MFIYSYKHPRMLKKLLGLLLLIMLQGGITSSFSQNEKIKTIFILNFIKNTNWHSDVATKSFNVLVIGNKQITNELNVLGKIKSSGIGSLNATYSRDFIQNDNFDIIVISKGYEELMTQIDLKYKNKPVLIITDECKDCENGVGINIINSAGKLSYQISKANIESRNLTVTNKLLSLGKQVD